ncbi:MAG: MFS transporter [Acidobacteriota bacterium]|nr:MFS transporter [Blastocatellia bacterium]MDW8239563.1 MFS transporter [Acidobacteriota bacterium]
MNKKTIFVWCLYDFANSIFYAIIPATIWSSYYANAIVGNETGQGDLWWGRVVSTAMLLVAVTSPVMGAIADYTGVRKRLLVVYTLLSIIGTCLLATVQPGMILWGFLLSVVAYMCVEGGLVFYNAYLPEIAPADYQGRVSGWGFALGYAGSLIGLLVALPLVQNEMFKMTFLLAGLGFFLFALPALLLLPADEPARMTAREAASHGARGVIETFRSLRHLKQMRRFLISFFFYEDGVNTVINVAALFAAKTLGFTPAELIYLFATVQISALVGALLWAKPTDRRGPKFVVMTMLAQWIVVVGLAYFVQTKLQFFVIAVLAGSGLGAVQAASRAFMALLIPVGKEAEYFGLYALCGKSASVMGPILFGAVSSQTGGNQRIAILSIIALYVIGAVLLARVQTARAGIERFSASRAQNGVT